MRNSFSSDRTRRGFVAWMVVAFGLVPALPLPDVPLVGASALEGQSASYVVLVRHAEKMDGDDPDLTPAGYARAATLVHALSAWDIEAVYSSQFLRTRATAAPLADATGQETIVVDARDVSGLAARIRDEWKSAVAVIGHSNTVPAIARALGVPDVPEIPEYQYDDLYVVRLTADGAELIPMKFGTPTPAP